MTLPSRFHRLFATLALALGLGLSLFTLPASAAEEVEKVVYHITDSINARQLLNNVRNHLNAAPSAKIVVVGHGKGIDFMLKDALDAGGNPYIIGIEMLTEKGVEFRACRNTLKSRKLEDDAVEQLVKVVPSGVAEVARLQSREGFVYLKP